MNRKEITNSQDYKATEAALEWWYSLPEEQRKATDIDAEPDIVDAYSDGVLYGWNNPNWISVVDDLPPIQDKGTFSDLVLVCGTKGEIDTAKYSYLSSRWQCNAVLLTVTHWMPLPTPPMKGGQ